ncbi:hypothetical protein AN218_08290, partial [Streptomyces nanshensis]
MADLDLSAGLRVQRGEGAGDGRDDLVLHLHRLQPQQRFAHRDGGAHGQPRHDTGDGPRHRGQQRTGLGGPLRLSQPGQRGEGVGAEGRRRVDVHGRAVLAVPRHLELPAHTGHFEHDPAGLRVQRPGPRRD